MIKAVLRDFAFDAWLKQLRKPESGKHQRALFSPFNKNHACCLGHACIALIPDMLEVNSVGAYSGADGSCNTLPQILQEFLDILPSGNFEEAVVLRADMVPCGSLAGVNDYTDLTPQQIADVIEAQY